MTQKEIKLGQTKYFILQYLRASPSSTYNSLKLAKDLELSERCVKTHLRDMHEMGVISDVYNEQAHCREIIIQEEWLH